MDDRTASKAAQLWTYIALRNYPVPSAPATEVAQKGIRRLWRRLRPSTAATAQAAREVRQTSSEEFFGELFRRPEWEAAAATLATAIEDEQSNGVIQQVFVGGPHRCTSDMLRHLARSKEWPVLEGPGADAILEGQFERPDVPEGTVVIIPQLAHWFLRHNDGLDTIRRLVDWLLSARQRAVLGCHSWAWRYLEQAIQIGGAFFEPRVLAPLDAAALKRWLGELATVPADRSTVFREASTGRVVLELPRPEAGAGAADAGVASNLLTHIASQGRGLPEITWSLWRESILRFRQSMLAADALKAVKDVRERTIWVPSWAQLHLPELPGKSDHLPLFVMHTLLLHAGLRGELLPRVLPFSREEIQRCLRELQSRGVAEVDDGRWRVTAAGYPAVRGALNDEGYLVDSL